MGKGNRSKKATTDKTDDELLDEAAAANRAAVAAALADTTKEMTLEDGCPTKAELLEALDQITLFDLRSAEDGDGSGRTPCLSPAGEFVFYVDENDAVEAMEARKQTHPGRVALGCTGLGRAFALSEGRAFGFSSSAKFPMRLQGSTATIKAIGDADARRLCPPTLRKQLNERTSTLPMLSLKELVEGTETAPYFFSHADLVHHWTSKTGKPPEEFPSKLVLTDLRVLIVRMMQVPHDWQTLKLVPSASSVEWLRSVTANQNALAEAAKVTAKPKEAADAPPALKDDDCPPLV